MSSTYHSDMDSDEVKYLIYERDTFRRKSDLVASTDDSSDVMAILYDNANHEKSGRTYRFEYDVVKAVGVREREVSRTTYTVQDIMSMNRRAMEDDIRSSSDYDDDEYWNSQWENG